MISGVSLRSKPEIQREGLGRPKMDGTWLFERGDNMLREDILSRVFNVAKVDCLNAHCKW